MFFSPVRAHRAALNGYGYVPSAWTHADAFDRVMHDRVLVNAFEGISQRSQIQSDEQSITLTLDVPGLSKEQLTIGIEGRVLRIASKDDAPRSVKATYKLGSDVDASQSQAKLENGVLTLKFAKVAPESRQTFLTIE
jgi:HSP20 family protein